MDAIPPGMNYVSDTAYPFPATVQVSQADLRFIVDMGDRAYPGAIPPAQRAALVERMFGLRSDIYQFIATPSGERVGYTAIAPLTEDSFRRHLAGELSQFDFVQRHVEAQRPTPDHRFLYIGSFVIDRAYLRVARQAVEHAMRPIRHMIYHHLARHMSLLNRRPDESRPSLSAEVFSALGCKFLTDWGFAPAQRRSAGNKRLFWLDATRDESLSSRARFFLTTICHWAGIYGVA